MALAFSSGNPIQQVRMTGQVVRYTGDSQEPGQITLIASSSGQSEADYSFAVNGAMSEVQSGLGLGSACQRIDSVGQSHPVDLRNCWRPALWFLPAFSLQLALQTGDVVFTEDTPLQADSGGIIYPALRCQFKDGSFPAQMPGDVTTMTSMLVGIDPGTSLPAVLGYSGLPDGGGRNTIAFEVRYSDFRSVSGVQLPFHIQRYANGALQLDILLNDASIN